MKRIHEVISNNISWYQAWHGTRFHALVHWGIVAFATVVSTGLMTLGLFVAPAAIVEAQVTASDIQTVTQRLNAEATSCSTVSSTVSGILGTTPGQDWTPDNPSEWENVAWLTRAYGCGQGSTQVLNRLIAALDYAEPRTPFDSCNWTTDGTGKLSNCWWIDQGINQYLGPAMLYGGGNLPGSVKPRVDADYRRFWDKARTFDIGADAIWAAFNMLYGALYFEDQSRLDNVIILAEASTTSNTGHNGSIQRDWSYFYHWDKINNWYGPGNARDTAKYLKITQGTGLDIAQTAKDGFYQWFKHWNQWILYKGYVDPLAVSKYPYWQNGYNIESGANTLTTLNDPNYSSFQSVFSSITTGSDAPFGSLSYPFDSYLAIRRAGWFAGIKLVSLADPHLEASSFSPFMGAVNILTPQTVDEKLSGSYGDNNATLIQYPHLALGLLTTNAGEEVEMYAANQNYKGSTPPLDQWGWYGVTTLEGNYAMAGESLNWDLSGGNLTMKKAWFVFDDEVISTQTGNTSDPGGAQTWMMSFKTNNPSVQSSTGVQQLSGGSGSVLNFGSPTWLYTNGNGFVFLKGESVKAKVMEPGYGRVYVDHGSTFSSVTAVLPGKSQTFTSGYPSNAVDILQLDSNAHVLKDKTSGVIGAAVYSSVSLPEIGLNKPGYLLMKPGSSLSLFNPHLESQLGLSDPNLGKGFNPKFDVYVTNPTITAYNITLPSSVSKSSTCTGCNVFSLDTTGKVLTVNLRVNRKFEIHIQGGQITEANIGLNDADAGTTTAGGGGGNPTCGDGTCNGSETIQSCPVDCTSLGGGGGGGNAAPLKPTLTLVSGGGGSCTPGGSCSVNTCPGTYICQGNQQMCQDTPGDGCPASAGGAVCGNNQIESGEACDGTAGHNQTCQTRGFTGGTLTCNPSGSANQCQFNTSQCSGTPSGTANFNPPYPRIGAIYFYEANIPQEIWKHHDLIVSRYWYPEIAQKIKAADPTKIVIAANNVIDGNVILQGSGTTADAAMVQLMGGTNGGIEVICHSGSNNGNACSADAQCPGGGCGPRCIPGWHWNDHPGNCMYNPTDSAPSTIAVFGNKRWNQYLPEWLNSRTDWSIFDGVFWDSWKGSIQWETFAGEVDLDGNGSADGATSADGLWRAGNQKIDSNLRALMPPGKVTMAHEADAAEAVFLNGLGSEGWSGACSYDWWKPNVLDVFANQGPTPRVNFIEGKGTKNAFQGMRYGLTAAAVSGAYYGMDEGAYAHRYTYIFDEYITNLGHPTGNAQQLQPGVFVRYFDQGVALVNGSQAPVTILSSQLSGGPYWRFKGGQVPSVNSGAAFSSVTLNGATGNPSDCNANATGDGILLFKDQRTYVSDIIVDNVDINMTSPGSDPVAYGGSWTQQDMGAVKNTLGYAMHYGWDQYGPPYAKSSQAGATATYQPTIGVAGDYNIYMWYPDVAADGQGSACSAVSISTSGMTCRGMAPSVNQSAGTAGKWNMIGNCTMNVGSSAYVRLTAPSGGCTTVSDAIKFSYTANTLAEHNDVDQRLASVDQVVLGERTVSHRRQTGLGNPLTWFTFLILGASSGLAYVFLTQPTLQKRTKRR